MIKIQSSDVKTLFLIFSLISGVLYPIGLFLFDTLLLGMSSSLQSYIFAGVFFGVFFGGCMAFIIRKVERKINYQGSTEDFQRMMERVFSKLNYVMTSKGNVIVISQRSGNSPAIVSVPSETNVRIEANEVLIEGPWIYVRKLKPVIETTSLTIEKTEGTFS